MHMATRTRTLTARQQQIVEFISTFTLRFGFAPTVREIGRAMGISSPNGVRCHIKSLVRKGVIQHSAKTARGLVVVADQKRHTCTSLPYLGEVR